MIAVEPLVISYHAKLQRTIPVTGCGLSTGATQNRGSRLQAQVYRGLRQNFVPSNSYSSRNTLFNPELPAGLLNSRHRPTLYLCPDQRRCIYASSNNFKKLSSFSTTLYQYNLSLINHFGSKNGRTGWSRQQCAESISSRLRSRADGTSLDEINVEYRGFRQRVPAQKSSSQYLRQTIRGPTAPGAWWDFIFGTETEPPPDWPGRREGSTGSSGDPQGASPLSAKERLGLIGGPEDDVDDMLMDDERFQAWQSRREAYEEIREYQRSGRTPESRAWEDWIDKDGLEEQEEDYGGWYSPEPEWKSRGMPKEPVELPERGMSRTYKEFFLRSFWKQDEVEDELSFEERIFVFTSQSTAKFVVCLLIIPWIADFTVHDFFLLPFLTRWTETVPLASDLLDVRESQKLQMIERLKLERQRVRFEADIGKAPPLSDEELAEHMHDQAQELRDEIRRENRSAFANIWSDMVASLTGLALLIFNPNQVAIMRLTGDRIFTNVSDTGKAFIIILCTDIFLGYHSELGWETVIEMFLEHYGLESDIGSIHLFVATVPVTIDACFKLWVFRYLTRLSPSAAATFREMKRH